jgi:ribosomal-protein-alanine N-acetyltransferase
MNVLNASMDYYLLNQFWRGGIAAEAVKLALAHCWDIGPHRMEATIEGDNLPSIQFAEKLGMVYEGVRREGAFINGAWRYSRVYSKLVGEIV